MCLEIFDSGKTNPALVYGFVVLQVYPLWLIMGVRTCALDLVMDDCIYMDVVNVNVQIRNLCEVEDLQ